MLNGGRDYFLGLFKILVSSEFPSQNPLFTILRPLFLVFYPVLWHYSPVLLPLLLFSPIGTRKDPPRTLVHHHAQSVQGSRAMFEFVASSPRPSFS